MVALGEVVGLILLLVINTILAAITTRFCRIAATTRLGTVIAIFVTVSFVLITSTMILSGVFHLGINLQDRMIAVMVAIGLPFALGVTLDYLWVASPEEVEAELTD